MILGEQRGDTDNPKGGITENFGRVQRGTTQICLENEDMGVGEGHFSELTFKGGSAKFHLV